jgi:hypothetical protein
MILAESVFTDFDGPTIERLGLVIFALHPKQFGEIIVADCNDGMILAEDEGRDADQGPDAGSITIGDALACCGGARSDRRP